MIKRDMYLKKIEPFIGKDVIKVLTGIRRCGKSVMLRLIQEQLQSQGVAPENIIGYNFEEYEHVHLCTAESLHAEIEKRASQCAGKVYLFFDEIQEVAQWEKCINSLRVSFDCDIFITGSNARLLSGELATYLAGRYVEFVIYPFSFEEFVRLHRTDSSDKDISGLFREFLIYGGMPPLADFMGNRDAAMQYLKDIYNSVVLKDIVKRNALRNVDLLERIILFLFDNIGHPFSANRITAYFRNEQRTVSNDTIMNYIKACTDAFLLYKASRQDIVGKRILSVNEKYYMADHGLRESLLGRNLSNIDQVLENIIYLELLRRDYSVTVGFAGDKEIDFIGEKGGEKVYVQVTYLLADEKTAEREFGVYRTIPDNYPKYVVSMDEINLGRDGIRHRNIRDFLLEECWE